MRFPHFLLFPPAPLQVPLLAIAIAVLGTACADRPEDPGVMDVPVEAEASRTYKAIAADRAVRRPSERAFFALARLNPHFAGLYVNGAGEWVLNTTSEPGASGLARLFDVFRSEYLRGAGVGDDRPTSALIRVVDHTFMELDLYRTMAEEELLGLSGAVYVDLDERANQVVVGVADEPAGERVLAEAAGLDVPESALSVSVVGTPSPLTAAVQDVSAPCSPGDLRDYCRPLIGGYQISFFKGGSEHLCTLMAPAIWGGDTVFVTASHCSEIEWDLDGEVYYQNDSPHQIGVETLDPNSWRCAWYSMYNCRNSDALLAASQTPEVQVGYIARTTSLVQGNITVDSSDSVFVVSGVGDSYVGQTVYKVGRTSGWTTGTVEQTCVSYEKSNFHRVVCTDMTDMNAEAGDSGGPIFRWSGSGDTVTLVGLVFARVEVYDHTFFSPISGIESDLGSLEFRAAEYRGGGGGGGSGGSGGGCVNMGDEIICPE